MDRLYPGWGFYLEGKKMKHVRNIPICANTLFIYKLDIKDDLTLKFTEEEFKPSTMSAWGTSLIGKDLNILKKYKELNEEINKAINETIKKILRLENTNYRVYSSWLTKTESKGFSGSHFHANSWLSGIYYPVSDPGFCVKFFFDNKSQFKARPIEMNMYNSNECTIIPEDNFLILFFSQLRHKIMPNLSKKDRFSLSFNLLPKGEFGEGDSKTIF